MTAGMIVRNYEYVHTIDMHVQHKYNRINNKC